MGYGSDILSQQPNTGATYVKLCQAIWDRHGLKEHCASGNLWPYVLRHLSRGEQAALLAREFYLWFSEGGFDGFFFEGDNFRRAHETVNALRILRLDRAAHCLKKAIEIVGFPDPVPADFEYVPPEPPAPALEQLGREFRAVRREESLEMRTLEYLRQHPEEFV